MNIQLCDMIVYISIMVYETKYWEYRFEHEWQSVKQKALCIPAYNHQIRRQANEKYIFYSEIVRGMWISKVLWIEERNQKYWMYLCVFVVCCFVDVFHYNDIPQWSLAAESYSCAIAVSLWYFFFYFHYILHKLLLLLQLYVYNIVQKRILINKIENEKNICVWIVFNYFCLQDGWYKHIANSTPFWFYHFEEFFIWFCFIVIWTFWEMHNSKRPRITITMYTNITPDWTLILKIEWNHWGNVKIDNVRRIIIHNKQIRRSFFFCYFLFRMQLWERQPTIVFSKIILTIINDVNTNINPIGCKSWK